jgi:hypothetical protein
MKQWPVMDSYATEDERVRKAYELAYFIHGDKRIALSIVAEAMAKLEVASAAQDKRLYYRPGRRSSLQGSRTKMSLSELHLLQRLVYIESEPFEKERERFGGGTGEVQMTIHFVKHLVRITVKRSSFYVTLGLSRMLHRFSTPETMEIYNVVVQDPDRVRDDSYYRSRKGRLLKELKERFGHFLQINRGPHGEERFQTQKVTDQLASLVCQCLNLFTPWMTPCVVPAGFNPICDTLPQLSFKGDDPDEEHPIEICRCHSVLHPDCFSRLTEALRFGSPRQRLEVPKFFLSQGEHSKGAQPPRSSRDDHDRRRPPDLEEEDLAAIKSQLAERAARRRLASGGLLRVLVDGTERGRLDPRSSSRIRIEAPQGAELVEVRGTDDRGEFCSLRIYSLSMTGAVQSEPRKLL